MICYRCGRRGRRGYERYLDRWVCANATACQHRQADPSPGAKLRRIAGLIDADDWPADAAQLARRIRKIISE